MVVFNAENHTYKNPETGRYYTSVSGLLKKYKEPFDADFFASRTAAKTGKTKEQVLEEWAVNNKQACDKGHTVHDIFESYIKTGEVKDEKYIGEFKEIFNIKDYKKVNSEKIVYDDENEIAGTSDIIADVDDNYFDVLDFKTNKKFLFFNKYNKYLLHPVSHLQECQYNDYSLQLSLYAYLYSLVTGKRLRQIRILYHDGNKFHTYPVPYLYWEIKALIKNHGQKSISESKTNPTAVQS